MIGWQEESHDHHGTFYLSLMLLSTFHLRKTRRTTKNGLTEYSTLLYSYSKDTLDVLRLKM